MTQIGTPEPTIIDQDAFAEAVRKIKEGVAEKYSYTMPHEEAVNLAMGKKSKIKVSTPTLQSLATEAEATGWWGQGADRKPTVNLLSTRATQTGRWGFGDEERTTLDYAEQMGATTIPSIDAAGLIGEFDAPVNEQTRTALLDTLRRRFEETYHFAPTDMQLSTLIDGGTLTNVSAPTLAGAKLETDVGAQTGVIRGEITLAGRQMDLTETMSDLDAAIARASQSGTFTDPETGQSTETLESKKFQLQQAQVSGYLDSGEPVLQLLLAEMDETMQEKVVFGFDRQKEDGTWEHVYGTNEIGLVSQARDQRWEKMQMVGFDYVDPLTSETRHCMGNQELLDHQWTLDEMTRTGYDELVTDADGNPVYGPTGEPLIRHTMGSQEWSQMVDNRTLALQAKGMNEADARFYAQLEWDQQQWTGFEQIVMEADGETPKINPSTGEILTQWVRGTAFDGDLDRQLQKTLAQMGYNHDEVQQELARVHDREMLNGWEQVDLATGEIVHVMGSAEWQEHYQANDQVYQTAMQYGGWVTAQRENGSTYSLYVEGSVGIEERMQAQADNLVREGWRRQDALAYAEWVRDQKTMFGYHQFDARTSEYVWQPGTYETEHNLNLDTLEKQDAMVRHRESIAHYREIYMEGLVNRNQENRDEALRDWQTIENALNRIHDEKIAQINWDNEREMAEWKQEQDNQTAFINGIAGLGVELTKWGWGSVFGDDAIDWSNAAEVGALGTIKYWEDKGIDKDGAEALAGAARKSKLSVPEGDGVDVPVGDGGAGGQWQVTGSDGTVRTGFASEAEARAAAGSDHGAVVEQAAAVDTPVVAAVDPSTVDTWYKVEGEFYATEGEANARIDELGGGDIEIIDDGRYNGNDPFDLHYAEYNADTEIVGYRIGEETFATRAEAEAALRRSNDGPADMGTGEFQAFDAEGNLVKRFETPEERDAYLAEHPELAEGARGDALNADQALGRGDHVAAIASFALGWAKGGNDVGARRAMLDDAEAFGGIAVGSALTGTCFPYVAVAYAGGKMAKSIRDSWNVPDDVAEARDAAQMEVDLSPAIQHNMLQGLPDDVAAELGELSQDNLSRIIVYVTFDQDWDINTAPPGEYSPPMSVRIQDGSSSGRVYYEESVDDFSARTGYWVTSWRYNENDVFSEFPEALQEALSDLDTKPTSMLVHPDGYVSFLGRDNKALIGFEPQDYAELVGDTSISAKRVGGASTSDSFGSGFNMGAPDVNDRGEPMEGDYINDAATTTGLKTTDIESMATGLPSTKRRLLLQKLARPGYQFTPDDIKEIFGEGDNLAWTAYNTFMNHRDVISVLSTEEWDEIQYRMGA